MSAASKFLIGLLLGVVGVTLALATLFVGLDAEGALKAPPFANRLSFDEKLRVLRADPPHDVKVLFAGSSTTLHGLDGDLLRRELGLEGTVLNLGVQDLRVNQIKFLVQVFLEHFPTANRVVMVSTLLDYKNCGSVDAQFFNPDDVLDYLSGGWPTIYYYFRYLDLEGVLKRAGEIQHLRNTIHDLESVSFDAYGSLLLEVPRDRVIDRVWEGDPITLDPPCYTSLHALADDLQARGVDFTFVIAPMRPGYLAGRDPDGSLLARHRAEVHQALAGTDAAVLDAHAALDMPEEAFFDAYHLKREKARMLTRFVGEQMTTLTAHPERNQPVKPASALTRTAPTMPPAGPDRMASLPRNICASTRPPLLCMNIRRTSPSARATWST